MSSFIWAVGASIVVSLISIVGIFTFLIKEKVLDKTLFLLIGFSAGGLIGGAFLHLLPEAVEKTNYGLVSEFAILGFILFFILERYFHWRHCHDGHCDVHAFTYLNLIGDGIHNFTDGLIIGASFTANIHFGVITTLVIIFHEIPQEIGDFGVLVYGGFSRLKALFYNFVSALTCILGTVIGYYLSERMDSFFSFLLPITAGGFIYIASCDLIPELHKQARLKDASLSIIVFIFGVLFIWLTRGIHI